jgi:hypothetical protein
MSMLQADVAIYEYGREANAKQVESCADFVTRLERRNSYCLEIQKRSPNNDARCSDKQKNRSRFGSADGREYKCSPSISSK